MKATKENLGRLVIAEQFLATAEKKLNKLPDEETVLIRDLVLKARTLINDCISD